jgi:probable rRNA maturation factor
LMLGSRRQRMEDEPPYDISVLREAEPPGLDEGELEQAIRCTLKRHGCRSATLSLALVDDARMAAIHERFLGRRGPTDVISFDLSDNESRLEGEVVVSVDAARRQSRARGHSPAAELALYAVHGTLHLLGFDDATPGDARAMHDEEDRILTELGYGRVFEPGSR